MVIFVGSMWYIFSETGSGGNSRITFKWSDRFKDKANISPSKYMVYAIDRLATEVRFKKKFCPSIYHFKSYIKRRRTWGGRNRNNRFQLYL